MPHHIPFTVRSQRSPLACGKFDRSCAMPPSQLSRDRSCQIARPTFFPANSVGQRWERGGPTQRQASRPKVYHLTQRSAHGYA
jgi:hypothetical protein